VEELAIVAKMMGGVLLYAVRVFDSAMAHPDLMRLMAWFSLEQKADSPEERGAARDENVAALTAIMALHGLDGSDPFGSSIRMRISAPPFYDAISERRYGFSPSPPLVAAELLGTRRPTRATATCSSRAAALALRWTSTGLTRQGEIAARL
jgi:hypothetical protein